jgi:hypothetical protein
LNQSGPADPITIAIAGWPVTLRFAADAAPARARFAEHYQAFRIPPPGEAPAIQVRQAAGPPFISPAPGPWQIRTEYAGDRFDFVSYFERGWASLTDGQGELTLRPEGDPENFLRVWYAWQCLAAEALLLHACGVVRGGRGFVFFGASGSGKTTTARLSLAAGGAVLSDDLVILKKDGGAWWVYGVPFRGEMLESPRTNLAAPAHGLYALVKDAEHRVAPLHRAEAAARLSACVPFVMARPSGARQATKICADLAGSGRVHLLRFRRDAGFWSAIDGPE